MDLTFGPHTLSGRGSSESFMAAHIDGAGKTSLPQEIEQGNVEYKLKLINPPPERLQHLVTQLKWRLAEGHGEAMYEIGVSDHGELVGLSRRDMQESLSTLKKMGEILKADVSIIRERVIQVTRKDNIKHERMLATYSSSRSLLTSENGDDGDASESDEDGFGFSLELDDVPEKTGLRIPVDEMEERFVAEVLVRKGLSDDQHFLEVRVAIVGGADAGKSTLLGVLADSELDNGYGKSRLNLLRHRHEIETGRTSSISHQIIGFNARGDLVNYGSTNVSTLEQICESSAKIVSFLDMCGHPKYQKTTLSGLTGHSPDYACLIISANAGGVSEVPREHLGIAVALLVPVFIVMTKVDVASPEQLTRTVNSLLRLLKSPGVCRVPMVIQNEDDLVVAVSSLVNSRVIPIFLTSSVTGENMDLLTKFLNLLPKPNTPENESPEADHAEFSIEETYNVPGLGLVVGGLLVSGHMSALAQRTETYFLGPDRGRFVPVRITSIHRQRIPVAHLSSGQAATLAISFLSPNNRGSKDADGNPKVQSPGSAEDGSYSANVEMSTVLPAGFKIRKGQVLLSFYPHGPSDSATLTASLTSPPPLPQIPVLSPTKPATASLGKEIFLPSTPSSSTIFQNSSPETGCVWEFEADIHVIHAASMSKLSVNCSEVAVGTSGVAYLGSVRQGARIVKLQDSQGKWAGLVSGEVVGADEVGAVEGYGDGELVSNGDYFIVPAKARRRSSSVSANRNAGVGLNLQQELDGSSNVGVGGSTVGVRAGVERDLSPTLTGGTPTRRTLVNFDLGPSAVAGSTSPLENSPAVMKRSGTPTPSSPRRQPQKLIIGTIGSPSLQGRTLSPPSLIADDAQQTLPVLRTGTHGRIRLRFSHEPEWVKVGSAVLFRGEDRLKCVGKVVGVVRVKGDVAEGDAR
ncbi:GTP binding protein [Chytriomyces hyalinus]|nr:GTP binding protein [Chytriomyces hyalinus]